MFSLLLVVLLAWLVAGTLFAMLVGKVIAVGQTTVDETPQPLEIPVPRSAPAPMAPRVHATSHQVA